MAGITLSELLKKMIEMGGSDLHITTNSAPRVRVHGRLRPLDMPPLTAADTKSLAYSVLTDAQKHRFEENLPTRIPSRIRFAPRFAKTLTSFSSAKCATSKPLSRPCALRKPVT